MKLLDQGNTGKSFKNPYQLEQKLLLIFLWVKCNNNDYSLIILMTTCRYVVENAS